MRVCLGVPNGGRFVSRLLTDLISAIAAVRGVQFDIIAPEGTMGPRNRWLCGIHAIRTRADYLWLVDADMGIPADACNRLMAHKCDIVGAAYNYRSLPKRSVVKMLDPSGAIIIPDKLPGSLFPCYAIGSGCKLIRVSALLKIPQPWFALEWDPKTGEMTKTDDVWFCEQARKVGISTYCDPTIEAVHIGDFQY